MAFITNGGAKLIQRAVQEKKALVFGSVRMNSVYESNPAELVQKSDSWYGANVGEVVGCLSHVSVDDVSCVRDANLAVQCNDNTKPWKSIGIYAHLEGEDDEILFACESIQNGDYKNVTIVELPVTLDGAVEDFGLSEGGGGGGDIPANMMTTDTFQLVSGGKQWEGMYFEGKGTVDEPQVGDLKKFKAVTIFEGQIHNPLVLRSSESEYVGEDDWQDGDSSHVMLDADGVTLNDISNASWDDIINAANSGGGDAPANMMTTNTEQVGLSGTKTWVWDSYEGEGTVDEPQEGDIRTNESISIDCIVGNHIPLVLDSNEYQYSKGEWYLNGYSHLLITSGGVDLNGSNATWGNIIKAAKCDIRAGQDMVQDDKGTLMIFGQPIQPSSGMLHDGIQFTFNGSGYLESVCSASGSGIATIGVIVFDENGNMVANGRVSGFSTNSLTPLTFQSPIQLQQDYTIVYQAIFSSPNS